MYCEGGTVGAGSGGSNRLVCGDGIVRGRGRKGSYGREGEAQGRSKKEQGHRRCGTSPHQRGSPIVGEMWGKRQAFFESRIDMRVKDPLRRKARDGTWTKGGGNSSNPHPAEKPEGWQVHGARAT